MGDLRNRDEYEARIAETLSALGVRQQRALVAALGDPPAAANLPPGYWSVYQQQLDDTLDPLLENVYIAYGEQTLSDNSWMGLDWDAFLLAAARYADTRARSTAAQMTSTTQEKTAQLLARNLSPQELRGRLAVLFGPVRARSVAVTEVTDLVSRSGVEIDRQLTAQGITSTPVWYTKEDQRVCPICGPLHLRKADGVYNDGTPYWIHPRSEIEYTPPPSPHPFCRCHVDYKLRNGVLI